MRPPAPGLYPKAVPPGGEVINGKFIPGGVAIGMNTASLISSTTHFGADAAVFRPERFTEASEVSRVEMERIVELVFGYGRFMCAGKPVAFMELNKVIFEVSDEAQHATNLSLSDSAARSCCALSTSRWSTLRSHGTVGVSMCLLSRICG